MEAIRELRSVLEKRHVLVGATGAIGVIDLPQYLAALSSLSLDIRLAMTDSANTMLPRATLGHLYNVEHGTANHVELARWADLFILLPCSAHTLGLLAAGQAPSLLTATVLAHPKPLLIFPAMNEAMWDNRAVKRNVDVVTADGHSIISPERRSIHEAASKEMRLGLSLPEPSTVCKLVARTLLERMGYSIETS